MPTPKDAPSLVASVYLSADALVQRVGEEAVILDAASEQYFGLNAVGARLWALLTEDPLLERARQRLLLEYAVEPAQLERDLQGIVQALVGAGLARVE